MDIGNSIELIIFDLDGTLVKLPIDWQKVKSDIGTPPHKTLGDHLELLSKNNDYEKLGSITAHELTAFSKSDLPEELTGTLSTLLSKYKIAILTRNSREVAETLLMKIGLSNKSIFVVGREDVRKLKPHPEGLDIILRHFEVGPARTVIVGDTHHDAELAKSNGIIGILIGNNHFTEDKYIYRAKSLKEIPLIINNLEKGA